MNTYLTNDDRITALEDALQNMIELFDEVDGEFTLCADQEEIVDIVKEAYNAINSDTEDFE